MDPYLRRLAAIPPLGPVSEHELAVRCWHGEAEARDELITSSLRLVVLRARLFGLHGSRLLDAVQAGTIGLIEAVDRFDPERGCRLATYAWWWIGRAMKQSIPAPDSALCNDAMADSRPPIEADDDLLDGLTEDLAAVLRERFGAGAGPGRSTPRVEVARRLGLTVSQVRTREAKALAHIRETLAKVGDRAPHQHCGAGPL
ncbi:MAG: hypothetical protein H7288_01810 [Kineosporiaceae bacterium]|nr:hypothetical protein [Aeromicrobium sp.]